MCFNCLAFPSLESSSYSSAQKNLSFTDKHLELNKNINIEKDNQHIKECINTLNRCTTINKNNLSNNFDE